MILFMVVVAMLPWLDRFLIRFKFIFRIHRLYLVDLFCISVLMWFGFRHVEYPIDVLGL